MNTTKTLFLAFALSAGFAIPSAYAANPVIEIIKIVLKPEHTASPNVDECNGTHNCDKGAPSTPKHGN